jgi:hypothetical protein
MTQQYLVGELSLLLAQLQELSADEETAARVAGLRRTTEERGLCALAGVEAGALEIADQLCWLSLLGGDVAAFDRRAAVCAQMWEFGVCAGLVPASAVLASRTIRREQPFGPEDG